MIGQDVLHVANCELVDIFYCVTVVFIIVWIRTDKSAAQSHHTHVLDIRLRLLKQVLDDIKQKLHVILSYFVVLFPVRPVEVDREIELEVVRESIV